MKLIRTNGSWHPGSYGYTDPRTGKKYDPNSADFDMRAIEIRRDRGLNPRIYPPAEEGGKFLDLGFIKEQLSQSICAYLATRGLASKYCVDDSGLPVISGRQQNRMKLAKSSVQVQGAPIPTTLTCRKCGGTDLKPVYCPTCSGSKIKYYECNNCHTANKK